MKEGKLTLTTDVTITEVMMDILQADCPCDITVDDENHLIISKVLENCEDVEEEIQHLKNIMKDLEGTMLNKEVEEEAKKAEEEEKQREADKKNIDALQKEAERLVRDVMAGKYGPMHIVVLMDNPSKIAYSANVHPTAAVALAIANLEDPSE